LSNQKSVNLSDFENSKLNELDFDLGILLELGSIGAGHAATALSEILREQISIDVPKILTIQTHLVPKFFNKDDVPTIAVYLQLAGTFGCDILLMFEVSEAKKIAAMMTMVSSAEELDPEMETSAIHELANIVIGSFLTAISDFIGISLLPTTPCSVTDTFGSIIDDFLIKQSLVSENALLFETRFKRRDEESRSTLMIFPSQELKEHVTQKSKLML